MSDLSFVNDHRLTILSPNNFSDVSLPIQLQWQVRDFTISERGPADGHHGSFLVFIDRSPMGPGETVDSFRPNDRSGIVATASTSYRFSTIPKLLHVPPGDEDHHEITVVLVDPRGARIGEIAGFVEFFVIR